MTRPAQPTAEEAYKLAVDAIDWLEANPDKHLATDMARDGKKNLVWPSDPSADCFCVLGRMVHDAGLQPDDFLKEDRLTLKTHPSEFAASDYLLESLFGKVLTSASELVYEVNDRELAKDRKQPFDSQSLMWTLGGQNKNTIAALRSYFDKRYAKAKEAAA